MSNCPISDQIAAHCDDADDTCPECGEELTLEFGTGLGEHLHCWSCGWHNAIDD